MTTRTTNSYQTFVYDFIRYDIMVVCPACAKCAVVKTGGLSYLQRDEAKTKVVCTSCGFNKKVMEMADTGHSAGKKAIYTKKAVVIGGAVDPYFQLPLWYTTHFEGNLLWAYNKEHIAFLKQHISAKLRERVGQAHANASLGSRLPKWMQAKKNREPILKMLDQWQD